MNRVANATPRHRAVCTAIGRPRFASAHPHATTSAADGSFLSGHQLRVLHRGSLLEAGRRRAGAERRDRDAAPPHLLGEREREVQDERLRRVVARHQRARLERGVRGHVHHDPPPPLEHAGQQQPRQLHERHDVHVQLLDHLLLGQLDERSEQVEARVVHQHVDPRRRRAAARPRRRRSAVPGPSGSRAPRRRDVPRSPPPGPPSPPRGGRPAPRRVLPPRASARTPRRSRSTLPSPTPSAAPPEDARTGRLTHSRSRSASGKGEDGNDGWLAHDRYRSGRRGDRSGRRSLRAHHRHARAHPPRRRSARPPGSPGGRRAPAGSAPGRPHEEPAPA